MRKEGFEKEKSHLGEVENGFEQVQQLQGAVPDLLDAAPLLAPQLAVA